jgi:hypothetical protein
MNIDTQARQQAHYLLRCIIADHITIFELEYDWPASHDVALDGVQQWLWTVCEKAPYTSISESLSAVDMAILRNCLTFLGTKLPFPVRKLTAFGYLKERWKWGWDWNVRCTLPDYPEWPFPRKTL